MFGSLLYPKVQKIAFAYSWLHLTEKRSFNFVFHLIEVKISFYLSIVTVNLLVRFFSLLFDFYLHSV